MIKTTLKVDGMMCNMCESHVNDAIRSAFSVKSVKSSHTDGTTEIISAEALDSDKLKATVEKTGYKVTDITSEPYEKKGLFSFGK